MATQKPRHTKYSSSTPAPAASGALITPDNPIVTPGQGIALYRLNTNNGATCILLKSDALIEVR